MSAQCTLLPDEPDVPVTLSHLALLASPATPRHHLDVPKHTDHCAQAVPRLTNTHTHPEPVLDKCNNKLDQSTLAPRLSQTLQPPRESLGRRDTTSAISQHTDHFAQAIICLTKLTRPLPLSASLSAGTYRARTRKSHPLLHTPNSRTPSPGRRRLHALSLLHLVSLFRLASAHSHGPHPLDAPQNWSHGHVCGTHPPTATGSLGPLGSTPTTTHGFSRPAGSITTIATGKTVDVLQATSMAHAYC